MNKICNLANILRKYINRVRWRKRNRHNHTFLKDVDAINSVNVGKNTYGTINVLYNGADVALKIGHFCSIGPNVVFILNSEHHINNISTYPFKVMVTKSEKSEALSKGDITIDDDVWIGYGATIMSGTHIGQGTVIAAGSLVSHDVPPYAIVGGVPAKVLKYRFTEEVIEYMLTLDYSRLSEQMIKEHVNDLYIAVDGMELNDIKELYKWVPKKHEY